MMIENNTLHPIPFGSFYELTIPIEFPYIQFFLIMGFITGIISLYAGWKMIRQRLSINGLFWMCLALVANVAAVMAFPANIELSNELKASYMLTYMMYSGAILMMCLFFDAVRTKLRTFYPKVDD